MQTDISLSRRSIWISQILGIAGLVAFVFLVHFANDYLHPSGQPASFYLGLLLVLIPTFLWLVVFYVQDHREPEPLHYVFRVTLIAAVFAGALALPLLSDFFQIKNWLVSSQNHGVNFLGGILIVAAIQEFCKYLAVRQVIYDHPEFDEVTDGVVYGTAAGLGVATMLNLHFVLQSESVNSIEASLRIVVTALAQGSFGGLMGYFLGRAKIHGKTGGVFIGYLLATLLNGVFSFLLNEISSLNFFRLSKSAWVSFNSWNSLAFAAAVSIVLTLILFGLVRKHLKDPVVAQ